ncbi:MAG: GSCFA domain-containing protein [Rhodobacteraceae bacterium]|nr:GSCFA domain-containing protein [Paracoccaceae bacterium]
MTNPYSSLDERAFWSPAVAKRHLLDIESLWKPKFRIAPDTRVFTYGSCFAQHFGRALKERGYSWRIAETAPEGLSEAHARAYNYGIFSSRTANIYTVTLFQQWVGWALGTREVPDEIWERDGRYFDPFRPTIEPGGFASPDELRASREMTIEAFRTSLTSPNSVLVFTLGLTESWFNSEHGYEYPMCPGTAGGTFDPEKHAFVNQSASRITRTLRDTIRQVHKANPRLKVLLTVSPVPLTATASGEHVLVATTYSKSVLRAAAGEIASSFSYVDYFPSYEIISSPPFRGSFFEPNLRSVNPGGVAHVMKTFFDCMLATYPDSATGKPKRGRGGAAKRAVAASHEDLVCEEELLNAFASVKTA